ncbi:gamma-glutamylcyclotransferase [Corallococcus sp. M34]|uniref:gamma-glutamylcyclotransferase n=1 Tax=Citreicoccus inhibens TaxID=2849499 RepID=UPI001C246B9A|nr:gamma-glutamylcyclotransferase [Citreicoccus inhibens]MBU8896926.1 gamma-glutamylcyclotransferase [Citreicoccus inhibens]
MPPGPTSTRPWFAFSLDLSPALAREHRAGLPPIPALPEGELAEALDVELVYDVTSPAWNGRVARLVDAPGRRLLGRLRILPTESWDAIGRFEAVMAEATEARSVRVRTATGATLSAQAFTPPARPGPAPNGPVSEAFLVALALCAERAGLAPDYVERLQAEAQIVHTLQRSQPATTPPPRKPNSR